MQDSIPKVIAQNKEGLERDLTRFMHLDSTFADSSVMVKGKSIDVEFEEGDVEGSDVVIKGRISADHHAHQVDLIRAKATPKGLAYEFVQDVDLEGKATIHQREIKGEGKYAYVDVRNQICQQLHEILMKHYSGEDAVKLVRKTVNDVSNS